MSKIALNSNASGTGVFTIASPNSDTDRTLTLPDEAGTVVSTSSPQLGRRNLIINGAMQVAQRATQVTGSTSTGYTTCDRFVLVNTTLGAWTVDQSTDAPDGFGSSFKVTCTTADSSPAAGDRFLYQLIEAQNLQQLAYGTSNAKNLTLSFWVKSNKTGTASVDALQNDNANKVFATTYTINSADTWEYKTISIPADTAGLINNDTGAGFQIDFWMNSGSNSTGGGVTSGWESFDNTKRNSSNLGVGGTTSDYFAITGIQLEVGDVATPFEHRSYGEEVALCQRYFVKYSSVTGEVSPFYASSFAWVSGLSYIPFTLTTRMRAIPTLTTSGSNAVRTYAPGTSYVQTSISTTSGGASVGANIIELETSGTSVTGWVRFEGQSWLAFDSEL
jgi:hypothetical protein